MARQKDNCNFSPSLKNFAKCRNSSVPLFNLCLVTSDSCIKLSPSTDSCIKLSPSTANWHVFVFLNKRSALLHAYKSNSLEYISVSGQKKSLLENKGNEQPEVPPFYQKSIILVTFIGFLSQGVDPFLCNITSAEIGLIKALPHYTLHYGHITLYIGAHYLLY